MKGFKSHDVHLIHTSLYSYHLIKTRGQNIKLKMGTFLFTIWLMWQNTVQFTSSETAHFLIQKDFRALDFLPSVLILTLENYF